MGLILNIKSLEWRLAATWNSQDQTSASENSNKIR